MVSVSEWYNAGFEPIQQYLYRLSSELPQVMPKKKKSSVNNVNMILQTLKKISNTKSSGNFQVIFSTTSICIFCSFCISLFHQWLRKILANPPMVLATYVWATGNLQFIIPCLCLCLLMRRKDHVLRELLAHVKLWSLKSDREDLDNCAPKSKGWTTGVGEEYEAGLTMRKDDVAKRREGKERKPEEQQELWQPIHRFGTKSCQARYWQVVLSPSKCGYRNWATPSSGSQELCFLSAGFLIGKRSKCSCQGNEWLSQLCIPSASQSFHITSPEADQEATQTVQMEAKPDPWANILILKGRSASNFKDSIVKTWLLPSGSGQCTDIIMKGISINSWSKLLFNYVTSLNKY